MYDRRHTRNVEGVRGHRDVSTGDDLKRVVQTTDELADKLLRAYALEIFTRVVRRTPIDEGTARGNWNVAQGAPDDTVVQGGRSTEPPALIGTMEAGNTYYVTNATPYIEVLEFGGYPNPPNRVVTIKKIDSSVNAVTIITADSALIDGAGSQSLAAQYDGITVHCDGTHWYILSRT